MQSNYSDKMIRLLKNPVSNIIRKISFFGMIIFIFFSVISLGFSIYDNNNHKKNPTEFNPTNDTKYSTLTPKYLSESFATGNGGTISYCMAVTADNYYYIVGIDTDKLDEYQDFILYSYNNKLSKPRDVVFTGVPQNSGAKITKFAVDYFSGVMKDRNASNVDSASVFGKYYLDTTMTPVPNYTTSLILLFFAALSGFVFNRFCLSRKKYQALHNDTIELAGESMLLSIDSDLSAPSTVHLSGHNGCDVYVTDTHIVSRVDAFEIIPLTDVTNLFILLPADTKKDMQTIVVVTKDGSAHEILAISTRDSKAYNRVQIINALVERIPDIQLTKPDEINEISVEDNTRLENAFLFILGIFGAVIGALLGGLLWLAIGKIGFIAGIAGFMILLLAVKGFSLATGRPIDSKTTIIGFAIAIIMIPFAELSSYALLIMNSFSLNNFIISFGKLPEVMTATNLWSGFTKNLVFGYLLSGLSLSKAFLSMFGRRNTNNSSDGSISSKINSVNNQDR